jgi:hypothetical protein
LSQDFSGKSINANAIRTYNHKWSRPILLSRFPPKPESFRAPVIMSYANIFSIMAIRLAGTKHSFCTAAVPGFRQQKDAARRGCIRNLEYWVLVNASKIPRRPGVSSAGSTVFRKTPTTVFWTRKREK